MTDSRQAGSTHPTEMHAYLTFFAENYTRMKEIGLTRVSNPKRPLFGDEN